MNIQDSAWTKRQKTHHPISIEKPSIKDYLLTFSIFVGCTVIGLVFQKLHFTDINIVTVYIPVSYTHLDRKDLQTECLD